MINLEFPEGQYFYELKIFFRHGNSIRINESVDAESKGQKYISEFTARRGVDTPASLQNILSCGLLHFFALMTQRTRL